MATKISEDVQGAYNRTALQEKWAKTPRGQLEGNGCPECSHYYLAVTEYWAADLVDPECWAGSCGCAGRNAEILEGLIECPECGPKTSDIHDGYRVSVSDSGCDCDCHCGCDFDN